jgi:hypothetical protein
MMMGAVINYSIPNIVSNEVGKCRKILETCGLKLLKKNSLFHFKKFSATDYLFASNYVAKVYPHLIESKLILMYRYNEPDGIINNEIDINKKNIKLSKNDNNQVSNKYYNAKSFSILINLLYNDCIINGPDTNNRHANITATTIKSLHITINVILKLTYKNVGKILTINFCNAGFKRPICKPIIIITKNILSNINLYDDLPILLKV